MSSSSNNSLRANEKKAQATTDLIEVGSQEDHGRKHGLVAHESFIDEWNPTGLHPPTEEEAVSLRRIPGHAPYRTYLICLIEFAERGSYYGVSGILANFIQRKLPEGSKTGAPLDSKSSENPGALGLGLQTASAITLLLTFLAYVAPLFGGYIADTKLGRLKTIWLGVIFGAVAHIILIIAAIPSVISGGHAIVPTVISIIILAIGTGFIKPNLLPLLMDQYPLESDVVKVLPDNERVIIDRRATLERMSLVFYWAINIGAFLQLATSYCERLIGFWLAYLIPGILYMVMPFVLWYLQNKMVVYDPEGSVLTDTWKVCVVTYGRGWISRIKSGELWEHAKPTNMVARGQEYYRKKKPITWDDSFVADVKQTFSACNIFVYYILYNINDTGIGTIETSQAGSMSTNGVPNDLFNNFNPLTIIVFIPFLDYLLYPLLRKYNIVFKPVHKIATGFVIAGLSQISGAIIQWKIYLTSPCGYYATTCDTPSPISAWVEVVVYILSAMSECFAMTTAYEVAYTRSPDSMKGLVMALFLFTTAISAAIGEALTSVLVDPKLIYPFAIPGALGVVLAFVFAFHFRNLDKVMALEAIEKELKLSNEKARQLNTLESPEKV